MSSTKQCIICNHILSNHDFSANGYGGLRNICMACDNIARANRRRASGNTSIPVTRISSTVKGQHGLDLLDDANILRGINIDQDQELKDVRLSITGDKVTKTLTFQKKQKQPEPIKPISITISTPKYKTPERKRDYKLCLAVPDIQCGYMRDLDTGRLRPYHDRNACDVVIQAAKILQPDIVVYIGDNLDLPEASDKFLVTPEMVRTLQPALLELNWMMGSIYAACGADSYWIAGNHDARLERNIIQRAPYLHDLKAVNGKYPLMSIPSLMDLDAIKVTYLNGYPNNGLWLNENFYFQHGHIFGSKSGETSTKMLQHARSSVAQGHSHRAEMAIQTTKCHSGIKQYMALSLGCLVDLEGECPKVGTNPNWQNSFGLITYEDGDGMFDAHLQIITKGKTIMNGQLITGNFDVNKLAHDTNYPSFLL